MTRPRLWLADLWFYLCCRLLFCAPHRWWIRFRYGTRFRKFYDGGPRRSYHWSIYRGDTSMGWHKRFRWSRIPPSVLAGRGSVRVRWSERGDYYYLPDYCTVGWGFWLSDDKRSAADAEGYCGMLDGMLQISPRGGEPYARHLLPFNFYEVRAGREGRLPVADDRVLDYLTRYHGDQARDEKRVMDFVYGRDS